jgi:hypothetical protein
MGAAGLVHSLAGWPALRRTMAGTSVPAEVVDGLAVPWHFAGMAMVLSGVLVALDLRAPRASPAPRRFAMTIGAAYVLFGFAGLALVKADPTFALFIVPGLLVLAAPR